MDIGYILGKSPAARKEKPSPRKGAWTKSEAKALVGMWGTHTTGQVAERLGRSYQNVNAFSAVVRGFGIALPKHPREPRKARKSGLRQMLAEIRAELRGN